MTMSGSKRCIFHSAGSPSQKKTILQYSSLHKNKQANKKSTYPVSPLQFFADFLLCFHESCVDLAAAFSVFNLCISCSWSIFHLFSSLFTISLFFSDLISHETFFFLSVFYAFLSLLAFYSIFLLSFSLHFLLFIFFLPIGLWRNILWKEVICMIFLWKHTYIYGNRSQHINL